MENNELNLDELMQINGGNTEVAEYIRTLASEYDCTDSDGRIDKDQLKKLITEEQWRRLIGLGNGLGGGRKIVVPRPAPGPGGTRRVLQ